MMRAIGVLLTGLGGSVLLLALWAGLTEPHALPVLRNGDIVFESAQSDQALAIMFATHSLYTHAGIVEKDADGSLYVIQAAQVVMKTPLKDFIHQSYGERITIMRFSGLSPIVAAQVVAAAAALEGRPYDFFFRLVPDSIYCSELVYDAFLNGAHIPLGHLQPIGSLGIDNFAVKKIIQARWQQDPDCRALGAKDFAACFAIIKARPIITPVSLARDARLEMLYSNY
jgi:hypothetical protein